LPALRRLGRRGLGGHPGVELEELFQPLAVVLETAVELAALQRLVVALVRGAH
jgi:hypothetical protein